jgi:O-antigen/teichoic acid export membrane protein
MDPDSRRSKKLKDAGKDFLAGINSGDLLKNTWQVGINSAIIMIINLLFNLIMSRRLGPSYYGELTTLLAINNLFLMSLSAVSLIVTRFAAIYKSRQQFDKVIYLGNWAFVFFFFLGMLGFFLNWVFINTTASYLRMDDARIIGMLGLLIWISFLIPIIEGILRGLQDFAFIGKYKLMEAVLRLIICVMLVFIGLGIKSIIAGIVVAGIITMAFSAYIMKERFISRPYKAGLKQVYIYSIPAFLSTISFAVLANIDLVLVKHFFDAETTGHFAAASILAKISMLIAFGSAGVMFPKIVESYSNGEMERMITTFRSTLEIALISGGVVTLLLMLFPKVISTLFFGKQYEAGMILGIFSVAMLFLGVIAILIMFNLARERYGPVVFLSFAAIIEIYQITKFHDSLYDVVWALFVVNALLMLVLLYYNRDELFSKIRKYSY